MTAKEMARELRVRSQLIREAAAKLYNHVDLDCKVIESIANELDPPPPAEPDGQTITTGNSRKERKE